MEKVKLQEKRLCKKDKQIFKLQERLRRVEVSFYYVCLAISRAVPELEPALIYVDDSDKEAGVWPMGVHPHLMNLELGVLPDFRPYLKPSIERCVEGARVGISSPSEGNLLES